jgi:hypothetical protein
MDDIDADLEPMTRERLIEEVRRLRAGVRKHRDTSLHALCWHQPELWGLLPEKTDPQPEVPGWPQFMRGCTRYRQSLDEQLPHTLRIEREYKRTPDEESARAPLR